MSNPLGTFLIGTVLLGVNAQLHAQAGDVDCVKCVDSRDIAYQAVTPGKIAQSAVTTSKLSPGVVTTGKIRDNAVTIAKVSPELSNAIGTFCPPDESVVGMDTNGNFVCESVAPDSIRAQVQTAIPLASEVRYLFAEFFGMVESFPLNNDAAGAEQPSSYQNNFVPGVEITGNAIVATFGNNADPQIQGDTLEFIPKVTGNSLYFTCKATGNVAAFFSQDQCVFIDEPPEPLTAIRRQVDSAKRLASEVRWMVVDYYHYFSAWPVNNGDAGAEIANSIINEYVESVTVGQFGVVEALFGYNAHPLISGQTITFTPFDNLGSVIWGCAALNIDDKYVNLFDCNLPNDLPPQPVTVVRGQIRSAIALAAPLQEITEQFRQANGYWPQSNAEAGAPDPDTIVSNYVSSVSVGNDGVITINYGNDAHRELAFGGRPQTLTATDNTGSISWKCGGGPIYRFNLLECR